MNLYKLSWLVFAISFAVTLFLWQTARSSNEEIRRARFHNRVDIIASKIREDVAFNERILLGCTGLFDSVPQATRKNWADYVSCLDLERTLPGIQGVGFGKKVSAVELASHVQSIREEGFATYTVQPPGERSEYVPVTYLEPFRDLNLRAFGYDMFSEPVRRAAMELARDEHRTTLSGMLTLAQEGAGAAIQHGFLMYHPVYKKGFSSKTLDSRRRSLLGYVYLPVRFGDFFDQIAFGNDLLMGIVVYDGEVADSAHLAYASTDSARSEKLSASYIPTFEKTVKLPVFGRIWTVKFFSLPSYETASDLARPWHLLLFGFIASCFLAGTYYYWNSRGDLQAADDLNLALEKARSGLEVCVQEKTADLNKAIRILRLLSECNKILIRAGSEIQLLEEMAGLVVRIGGYRSCLVAFAENDPERSLRLVVQKGFAEGFLQNINLTWADTETGRCPLGTAVRTRQSVIDNDVARKPICTLWFQEDCAPSVGSLLALPLLSGESTLGVIGILSTQAEAFTPAEVAILEEMAVDMTFGIETQRLRLARQRSEEKLQLSERDLRDAQALAHIGNWSIKLSTGEFSWSEEMYRIAGLDPSLPAPTFKEHPEVFTPESWQRATEAGNAAIIDGKPYELDLQMRRPDGTTRWVHAVGQVRRDSLGNVVELYGTNQDITSQREMLDKLRNREEKYRLLIEHLQAGVIVFSSTSKVLLSNTLAMKFLGLTPGLMSNMRVGDTVGLLREDRTPLLASEHPVTIVLATRRPLHGLVIGIPRSDEGNIPCPGGNILWVQVNAFPEFDDQNQVERVVVTIMDITSLKIAEQELWAHRESLERMVAERTSRLESIINTATDGIMVISQDGTITCCNPAGEKIFGYQATEIVGQNIHFFAPQAFQTLQDGSVKYFMELDPSHFAHDPRELFGVRKDGTTFPMDISVAEFSMDGKRMFNAFIRDISARKRVEDALNAAKELAQQASNAKSNFVANVSHEIRTPLNAIIGFANLALKTGLNSKQTDYLGKIHLSGLTLLGIVNDLLDFSKIEAGKLTIENIEFCFEDIVNNIVTMIGPPATARNLNIIVNIPFDFPRRLIGDSLRVGQILTNIMSNAVKFTERGEIELSVSHQKIGEDSVEIHVKVQDTGIGIATDQLANIFRPFTQADISTTRKFGGTGLGLAITKHLVELMGGKIGIESEAGKGTTVSFSAVFRTVSKETPVATIPGNIRDLHILVLANRPAMLKWFRTFFTQFSYVVDVVASPREAIAALEEKAHARCYDLFLIDSQDITGNIISLLQHLRTHPDPLNHPKIILLITAVMEDSLREQAIGLEVREFLVRPITPAAMLQALENIFSPQNVTRVVTSKIPSDEIDLAGLNVLVVEDNAMNQQIARELLESVGVFVTIANNGLVAVAMLTKEAEPVRFDAIFMDIQMPELDGYEAARRIRKLPRYAGIPIIALTGHAMVLEREKVVAAGMNDHVAKPITPRDLFQVLRHWTRKGQEEKNRISSPAKDSPLDIPADPEAFPAIPGVNIQEGMARLAGNARTYARLLKEFPAAQRGELEKIGQALAAKDLEKARTLIHTLKGLSGNLSISDMFLAAGALEKALPRLVPKIPGSELPTPEQIPVDESAWEESARQFGILRESFQRFSQAIETLSLAPVGIPGSTSAKPLKPMPVAEARNILGELKALLISNDPQAGLSLAALANSFEFPADCGADFQSLVDAMNQFEYEQALHMVESIERKL